MRWCVFFFSPRLGSQPHPLPNTSQVSAKCGAHSPRPALPPLAGVGAHRCTGGARGLGVDARGAAGSFLAASPLAPAGRGFAGAPVWGSGALGASDPWGPGLDPLRGGAGCCSGIFGVGAGAFTTMPVPGRCFFLCRFCGIGSGGRGAARHGGVRVLGPVLGSGFSARISPLAYLF